jgi:hypothetical protein
MVIVRDGKIEKIAAYGIPLQWTFSLDAGGKILEMEYDWE